MSIFVMFEFAIVIIPKKRGNKRQVSSNHVQEKEGENTQKGKTKEYFKSLMLCGKKTAFLSQTKMR